MHIYDVNNNLVSEFDCGVSPGTIVFDVRSITSINSHANYQNYDNIYFDLFGRKINKIESHSKAVYIHMGRKIFR